MTLTHLGDRRRRWGLGAAACLLALPLLQAAPAPEEDQKEEVAAETAKQDDKKSDETKQAAKPRVITNKDLEKYGDGRGRPARVTAVQAAAPEVPVEVQADPLAVLPPEDRHRSTTIEELVLREMELTAQLEYLEAKERWLRNPLTPAPTPTPGQALLDPLLSGAQELARTSSLSQEARSRLTRVRMMIQEWGGGS